MLKSSVSSKCRFWYLAESTNIYLGKLLQSQMKENVCSLSFINGSLVNITNLVQVLGGNGELLELRLLETGFLSRFQLNP